MFLFLISTCVYYVNCIFFILILCDSLFAKLNVYIVLYTTIICLVEWFKSTNLKFVSYMTPAQHTHTAIYHNISDIRYIYMVLTTI